MYWTYFKALCRHKWYVFLECCAAGIPLRGLLHDISKFRPHEFIAYAKHFYGDYDKKTKKTVKREFDLARISHYHHNKHHWQWWIVMYAKTGTHCIKMPHKYRLEMLCDWKGASKAYGNYETLEWYTKNRDKIQLHKKTRAWLEEELGYIEEVAPMLHTA